jgi:hypothetical protein
MSGIQFLFASLLFPAFAAISSPSISQSTSPDLKLTVKDKAGTSTSLTTKAIMVWTDVGYITGGSAQSTSGLFVTPPNKPSDASQPYPNNPVFVPWSEIRRLTWPAGREGVSLIEYRDGRSEPVLLWRRRKTGDSRLWSCNLTIYGTTNTGQPVRVGSPEIGDNAGRGLSCSDAVFLELTFESRTYF